MYCPLLPSPAPLAHGHSRLDVSVRLRRSIFVDDLLIVQRILKNNPQYLLNPDSLGNSSLHLAAQHGRTKIAVYLVDVAGHEKDGPSKNNAGDTPLHTAAGEGFEEVVHFLAVRFPRTVDWRNKVGLTPLMMAATKGKDSVVNMLLDMGADPDLVDGVGNTALHYASAYGHLKVIRSLIERGAPADKPNRQGWAPISYSCTFEAKRYFEQLREEMKRRMKDIQERDAVRARAATPVFGRSERITPQRQRASSGS